MSVFDNGGFIGKIANYIDTSQHLTPTTATITYVGGIVEAREGTGQGSKLPISLSSIPLQQGDMVIIAYESTGTVNKSLPIIGYTTIVDLYADRSRDSNLLVAYKFMGPSPDAQVTIERTDSADDGGAVVIQAYRGVDSQNPFDVASTTATFTASVIPNPPAITPITSGAKIVIAGGGGHNRGGGVVYQASYLSNFLSISRDAAINDAIVGMGHVNWAGGTYDPASFTFTGADNTSNFASSVVTMALRPGPVFGNKKNSGIWSLPAVLNFWRNKASIVWDVAINSSGGNNAYSGELKVGDVLFGFTTASYGLFNDDGFGNVDRPSPIGDGFTTIHANGNEGNSFYLVYKVITPLNINDPKNYYSGGGQASTILYNIRGLDLTQFASAPYTTLFYDTQFNNSQNYLKDRSLYVYTGTVSTTVEPPSITPAYTNSVILTFSTCCVNNFTPSLSEGYSLIRNYSTNNGILRTLTTTIKHGVSNTLQDPPSFGTVSASGDGTWHVTMALKVLSPIVMRGPILKSSTSSPGLTVDKPGNTTKGDLLVGIFQDYGTTTVGIPSGWTPFGGELDFNTGEATNTRVGYKIAENSEPSTYTFSSTAQDSPNGTILCFTNYNSIKPLEVRTGQSNNAQPNRVGASVTAAYNNSYLVLHSFAYPGVATSTPSGMTQLQNIGGDGFVVVYGESIANSGATGTRTHNHSINSSYTTIMLLINEAIYLPPNVIALAHEGSRFISVYPWNSGFGTIFANPATLPPSTGLDVAFTRSSDAVAVSHVNSPFISVYPWNNGFGTKFTNPATLPPGNGWGVAFTPSSNAIAVGTQDSPFITAYPWDNGFGTKFSNPSSPEGSQGKIAFARSGNAIANSGASNTIGAWAWSGSGFGTKYSNPSGGGGYFGRRVEFSPSNTAIAAAIGDNIGVMVWPWSDSTGFGTKFANPSTLPGNAEGVTFNPSETAIVVASSASPFIHAYDWSGSGFGSKKSNPATLPTNVGRDVAFTGDGQHVAIGHLDSPNISVYSFGDSFGTKLSNPGTSIPGQTYGVTFLT